MKGNARQRIKITADTTVNAKNLTFIDTASVTWAVVADPATDAAEVSATASGGGGGGGTSDHALLSHLSWSASAHTGTANRFAVFGSGGAAAELAYPSTGLVGWTGTAWQAVTVSAPLGYSAGTLSLSYGTGITTSGGALVVDTTTIATLSAVAAGYQPLDSDLTALAALGNGLPYRDTGTWSALSLTDLAVSGGGLQVTQARGLRETAGPTTLPIGAIAEGEVLVRSGGAVIGRVYSEGFDGFFEEMAGSGIAGDQTFDGSSAVTGWSLASRVYTLSATTTPVEFAALTIDTTGGDVTLIPKGMPLFAISLIILGSGTVYIDWSGGNASGSTAGVGAAPVSGAPYLGGGSGGAGRTTSGNGNTGSSMTSGTSIASVWAGNGGSAGTGTPRSGGASSSVSRSWSIVYGNLLEAMARGIGISASGNFQWAGGQGGGGGGLGLGVGGSGNSGAGGGGGGKVRLSCRDIDTGTATLVIRSNGGSPSNGNITGSAESGGGQGGYGGAIYFSALSITGSNPVQLIANGANGGNASAIGGAAGAGGDGGGGGRIVAVVPDGMTSKVTTSVTGGTKGTTIGSPVTPADDGAAGVAVVRGFGA